MKTCLYTSSYLDGYDGFGNPRLARNIKYIQYYLKLKDALDFDQMYFCDNASSDEAVAALEMVGGDNISIFKFKDHIARGPGYDYGYCWRALHMISTLIDIGYEKIICVDSDAFIVSRRLVDHIRELKSGWKTYWSKKYKFPTAELHILCKDAFPVFHDFIQTPWQERNGTAPMEKLLPYQVNLYFNCDRYGEDRTPQYEGMDLYSQCPNDIHLQVL